jgi:Flp pilus assembly pilin Flp
MRMLARFWHEEEGQDIAEYAVMVAVILIIVVGTVRLIGSNSNTVFSQVASAVHEKVQFPRKVLRGEGLPGC